MTFTLSQSSSTILLWKNFLSHHDSKTFTLSLFHYSRKYIYIYIYNKKINTNILLIRITLHLFHNLQLLWWGICRLPNILRKHVIFSLSPNFINGHSIMNFFQIFFCKLYSQWTNVVIKVPNFSCPYTISRRKQGSSNVIKISWHAQDHAY